MKHLEVGQVLPQIFIEKMTAEQISTYGLASNDHNAIHFDKESAQEAGFPDCIAHGMLTMGVSSRLISKWLSDTIRLKTYESTFRQPLIIGDSLTIEGIVKNKDSEKKEVAIGFQGWNQQKELIITGEFVLTECVFKKG